MHCCEEEIEKNVFRTSVLVPLIKTLVVYMEKRTDLSPDEFCTLLFVRNECGAPCDTHSNSPDLRIEELEALNATEESTVLNLFFNIVRCTGPLEAVSKQFLDERKIKNYEDLCKIMVLVYILTYRIVGLNFEAAVDCFDYFKIPTILSILSYLLRGETMDLVYTKGCSIFEESFVEEKLILPYMEAIPRLEVLRDRLKERRRKQRTPKREVTRPQTMNVLNRPRRFPEAPPTTPEIRVLRRIARSVPRTIYERPSTEEKLASLRARNKLQAVNLLKDADRRAPSCSRRRRVPPSASKVEEPLAVRVRKEPPTFKPVEVRHTAASILRECARIVDHETKEVKKLKELAEGGLDPSSITKMEDERRQELREEEMIKIQEKHLSALLSREGAFIAKQSLLNDLKAHAENVRKEKQELYERLESWRKRHNKEMTEIVERCREIEQASRAAVNSMVDEKRQKAARVTEESRQLRVQLSEQREKETLRKIRLIQEIKTIQSLRSLSTKDFDPTESSGLGLLCEMSLAELKERLFWMKVKLQEEAEFRKTTLRRERERQKNLIRDRQKALAEYKANKSSCSSSTRKPSILVSSPVIEALRKKLEEKRASRLQK